MPRMNRMIPVLTLGGFLAASLPALAAAQAVEQGVAARAYGAAAVESLYPQDPGDSLYRAARQQLNQENYRRAAELFEQVYARYPRSSYAAQALYYQAFALYRNGRDRDLRAAQEALHRLQRSYAGSEVAQRDAEELMARVEGALARMGDAEAAEGIARQAGQAEDECDEVRMAALSALLQMNSEQALPILRRVLANRAEDACSVEMRRKAVFLLSQHIDEESVDILLDIVRNDPDPEVREQAVFWLSQVPGERTVDALEDILLNSSDRDLQEKAIFSLSQVHSERAGQILRDYALQEDADPDLRANAIFWLGQQHSAETSEFLRQIYASTEEYEIKEKIIFSLAQAGDEESVSWLLDVAGDASEPMEMRKKALFWLGQSHAGTIDIGGLYEQMPERELKEQVIFALSQRHDEESVNKLLDIARTEEDVELRKKAIFWLSQSDDPRVAEFLLELIEGGGDE